MNEITSPLSPREQGRGVANLQAALRLLVERRFLANDDNRQDLLSGLIVEEQAQTYGSATQKVVGSFQVDHRLPESGAVDDRTAQELNTLLRDLGLLDSGPPTSGIVSGAVRGAKGQPLRDVRVQAVHLADRSTVRLGEDRTDAQGQYTIRYEPLPNDASIHLQVNVVDRDGMVLVGSDVSFEAAPLETIDLVVPDRVARPVQQQLEGHVVLEHGQPAEQWTLRLYKRDFGGTATLIAETTTQDGGRYSFDYHSTDGPASLEVRAVVGNAETPLSKPLNYLSDGTGRAAVLNLIAPGVLQPLAAEYLRLTQDVTRYTGADRKLAEATENAQRQDLTVLNRATGWDARLIALAATAERLGQDAELGLSPQVLYGLLRAGLPSEKQLLAHAEPTTVELALKTARDAGIVELTDHAIGDALQRFAAFSTTVRLSVPAPGSLSTYGELLKASGLDEALWDCFK